MQYHELIFWAKPIKEDFKTTVQKCYNILQYLSSVDDNIAPNYITANRKKDAKKFVLSNENVNDIFKKNINQENGIIFEKLGYSLSFFSSLENKKSASISIHIGVLDERFMNTLIITLPENYQINKNIKLAEKLTRIFKECCTLFNPFWGAITNIHNIDRFNNEYIKNSIPTTIHWVNYWDNEILSRVGFEKFKNIPYIQINKMTTGCIIIFQNRPIDDNSESDIQLQIDINKKLGLNTN